VIPLLIRLVGCGGSVDCREPDRVLAEQGGDVLSCRDARVVASWIELLAGRPVAGGDRGVAHAAVADQFRSDPVATRALVESARREGAALAAKTGLDGAEARAHHVFLADRGEGVIRAEHDRLWNLQSKALSVWTKDEEEQLAVTESDLEAWIRYASLCREAQGAGVLRISVGDRVTVYQTLIDRFDTGDRATQVGVVAFGAVWDDVRDRWKGASYERQQAWVSAAPLPPPMTASSMGYADAVFQGDLAGHARALHDALGPLAVGDPTGFPAGGHP
jgi:hypothetical protein